jgi:heat shock protein HslJ
VAFAAMEKIPVMKTILLFLLLAACVGIACTAPRRATRFNELDGGWVLAVFPHEKKTLAEVFGTRIIDLRFATDSNRVSGSTGCNQFNGSYTADTAKIRFSPDMALTRMACPGYDERLFLNAMSRVNRYRINEGQLELFHDKDLVMVFARKIEYSKLTKDVLGNVEQKL